jgi:hypothetical protein
VIQFTIDDGKDEIDGSEMNAVRRLALELLDRDIDDLSDSELMHRMTDEMWFVDLCLNQLHRLPSEVEPLMGCREYTTLQAYFVVKQAQSRMAASFKNAG